MSLIGRLMSLREDVPPGAALELRADRVSAACVEHRGGRAAVTAHASEPLPEGILAPALTALNIRDHSVLAQAVGRVLDQVGRPRRIGLILPDPVAKVSLLRFEHVPSRAADTDSLIRWQIRKAAPFAIDEAQVSYVPGMRTAEGQEFIVSAARRDIVQEYESLCAAAGAHAGIVDLSTFNVINAVLACEAPPTGDWLLVNVASDWTSIAIVRGSHLMFFRRGGAEGDGTLADLVHQTTMYYEDRLQGTGFAKILLCGAAGADARQAADVDQLRQNIEARLTARVETVDPRGAAAITDRIMAAPALLDTLAPLVGLLLRGVREAA
jgi:type IV pilus assembly protein PilM